MYSYLYLGTGYNLPARLPAGEVENTRGDERNRQRQRTAVFDEWDDDGPGGREHCARVVSGLSAV